MVTDSLEGIGLAFLLLSIAPVKACYRVKSFNRQVMLAPLLGRFEGALGVATRYGISFEQIRGRKRYDSSFLDYVLFHGTLRELL